MLDQRGRLLRAAVGLATISMPSYDRALWALRSWLDSWSGIGHVAVGMARQGYDLQLTRYDEKGWRATFYTTGMEHSPTSAEHGSGAIDPGVILYLPSERGMSIDEVTDLLYHRSGLLDVSGMSNDIAQPARESRPRGGRRRRSARVPDRS
jgi:hypothetical protein